LFERIRGNVMNRNTETQQKKGWEEKGRERVHTQHFLGLGHARR